MPGLLRHNGLTLAMFVLFALSLAGMTVAGLRHYNEDQQEHGQAAVGYGAYLTSGAFVEAIFENWESEFLQMGLYVLLTAFLYQRGSAESKDPDRPEEVDRDPRGQRPQEGAPGPVRRGGLALTLYEHSLTIALLTLFVLSFLLHAAGGAREYSQDQLAHGGQPVSTLAYLATARMWFESFQNWQSEFLSIGMLVVLSIVLRQKGSPESKPVAAPHRATGEG